MLNIEMMDLISEESIQQEQTGVNCKLSTCQLRKRRLNVFKGRINKHSMYCWMALQNGLKTRDLLVSRNIISSSYCIFCRNCHERSFRLFAECPFSLMIWDKYPQNLTSQNKDTVHR